MSEHKTGIRWNRDGKPFTPDGYSRDHEWNFERGQRLIGSAAPAYLGSAQGVDPEEADKVGCVAAHRGQGVD